MFGFPQINSLFIIAESNFLFVFNFNVVWVYSFRSFVAANLTLV